MKRTSTRDAIERTRIWRILITISIIILVRYVSLGNNLGKHLGYVTLGNNLCENIGHVNLGKNLGSNINNNLAYGNVGNSLEYENLGNNHGKDLGQRNLGDNLDKNRTIENLSNNLNNSLGYGNLCNNPCKNVRYVNLETISISHNNQKKMSHTKSALLTEIPVLGETKHSLTYLSALKSPEINFDYKLIQGQNVTSCQLNCTSP